MKIALFNCNMRSVPPKKSGGIEKIIGYIANGFSQLGHDVSLFSTGDSFIKTGITLFSVADSEIEVRTNISDQEKEKLNISLTHKLGSMLIEMQDSFDVINNHCCGCGLISLGDRIKNTAFVSSLHESLEIDTIARLQGYVNHRFISCSFSQRELCPDLNFVGNIYHAIDVDASPLPISPDKYLVYVGRISSQKAPHVAIEVARRVGMKLLIVGKYKDTHIENDYYQNIFLPMLRANIGQVEWLQEVDEVNVLRIFQHAFVSLHPVMFHEPFGLTLIESMSCGCPVIAFRRGSIPEVIQEGKTGFIVTSVDDMVTAVNKIEKIDRTYCRKYVKRNYDIPRLIDDYVRLYTKLLV